MGPCQRLPQDPRGQTLKANFVVPLLSRFLSSRLPGVLNNPWSVIEMLNIDKDIVHVDNRWKKLEKSSVQQIQDAKLRPASLLNCIRCVKSTSGYQNAELKRLAFFRLYLTDTMFSNTRSVSLLRDTRPTSLRQNAGLMMFAFLMCYQANATISNARSVLLLNRGTRPASQSQNTRAASFLQNMNSVSLYPMPLRLASQGCDAS